MSIKEKAEALRTAAAALKEASGVSNEEKKFIAALEDFAEEITDKFSEHDEYLDELDYCLGNVEDDFYCLDDDGECSCHHHGDGCDCPECSDGEDDGDDEDDEDIIHMKCPHCDADVFLPADDGFEDSVCPECLKPLY